MSKSLSKSLLTLTLVLGLSAASAQNAVPFPTSDDLTIHALEYPNPEAKAVVLLFHQAHSNKTEYAPIAPEFVKMGFVALAVDQRVGGTLFGAGNDTIRVNGGGYFYDEAMPDVEAAILWAKTQHPNLPVWLVGSSYSAMLVLQAAAVHPEVQGVLSFSPAMGGNKEPVLQKLAKLDKSAVFISSAKASSEVEAAKEVFEAIKSPNKIQVVPSLMGVHGASILRPERAEIGGTEVWEAVRKFISKHLTEQ